LQWLRSARLATAILLAAAATSALKATPPPPDEVALSGMGHLVVGGERITVQGEPQRPRVRARSLPRQPIDPNGQFTAGATYVQFAKLARPTQTYPIVMMPGGGLSGAVYETTPDGRPGWEWFFLRAGYSVFIADLQQTGRSPWARFPEIDPEEPSFRDRTFLWEVFRIGPPGSYSAAVGPRAYTGTRFPVQAFDNFAKLAAPRFRMDAKAEATTFDAIIERVCPCILLAHSASAEPSLEAAHRHPDLVKATVLVEPAAVPVPPTHPTGPELIVWGDYLGPDQTTPDWLEEYEASRKYLSAASQVQGTSLMELPKLGISGNSHLEMSDTNSDQVATLIANWLHSKGF
jgi:pimeloyl-ACP methyl ester carboxylesterase